MNVLRLGGILLFPTIVATVGFLYVAWAYLMIGWAWSDSFPSGWTASEWTLTLMLWSTPFLFSLWVVYWLTGSNFKYTVSVETLGAILAFAFLACWAYRGRGHRILLEQPAPFTEALNRGDVPELPLSSEAVGVELPDGKFYPIMFLKGRLPEHGYKTPLLTVDVKAGRPKLKVYRGTNDLAAANHLLGEFQISGYSRAKQSLQLMVIFDLETDRRLFMEVREVDATHNIALKPKRVETARSQ